MTKLIVLAVFFAVLHQVEHNGKLYKPKDTIELTPAEAQPLLAAGVIAELADGAEPAAPLDPVAAAEQALKAAISASLAARANLEAAQLRVDELGAEAKAAAAAAEAGAAADPAAAAAKTTTTTTTAKRK